MKLTVEDFIKIRNIIYEKAGIFFETKKIYFVNKRVEKRMEELNLSEGAEYYNRLKFRDKNGEEMQHLLNLMTTNETYFYREGKQLEIFATNCLQEILAMRRKKGDRRIKLWSAGCSSGEEPYTLAILLREYIQDFSTWNIQILATDIDTQVLTLAAQGNYPERTLRYMPPLLIKKYFVCKDSVYHIDESLKKIIFFYHLNLFDNQRMRSIRQVDFIFCRNVLIYFDDASRKTGVANFYDSLTPGGYIYLGHSESITRISTAFNMKRANGLIIHQKPGKSATEG